jgi:hypothetical protein
MLSSNPLKKLQKNQPKEGIDRKLLQTLIKKILFSGTFCYFFNGFESASNSAFFYTHIAFLKKRKKYFVNVSFN